MTSTVELLKHEMAVLVEKVSRSLVVVTDGGRGAGAGTVWHTKGLIVTNAHVVGGKRAKVTLADGRAFEATVLARDEMRDLAALAIDADGLPTIALADSGLIRPGQFVLALGHPWGVNGAAASGIIMGTGAVHLKISYAQTLLAVNLPLRPGNSGGPLVDMDGRLVGINSMMTGRDTGLAIPVNAAKAFLKETVANRV